jgi:hypothetical protein
VTVPEGANYTIESTYWRYLESGEWYDMTDTDVFDHAEYVYHQSFHIVPNDGYVFSDEVTVTINGDTAFIAYDFATNSYYLVSTIGFTVEEPDPDPVPIIGDVNLDGEVDMDDVLLLQRYLMGIAEINEAQLALADVNGDGEVSMLDALLIMRKTMGIIDSFPGENLPVTSLRIK